MVKKILKVLKKNQIHLKKLVVCIITMALIVQSLVYYGQNYTLDAKATENLGDSVTATTAGDAQTGDLQDATVSDTASGDSSATNSTSGTENSSESEDATETGAEDDSETESENDVENDSEVDSEEESVEGLTTEVAGSLLQMADDATATVDTDATKTIYFFLDKYDETYGWTESATIYVDFIDAGMTDTWNEMDKVTNTSIFSTDLSQGTLWKYEISASNWNSCSKVSFSTSTNPGYRKQTEEIGGYDKSKANIFFRLNGNTWGDNNEKKGAYCGGSLTLRSEAGSTINFMDMTSSLSGGVKAVFGGNGLDETEVEMTSKDGYYTVQVPANVTQNNSEIPYATVRFVDANDNDKQLGEYTYNFLNTATDSSGDTNFNYDGTSNNTFYYGVTENGTTLTNIWGAPPTNKSLGGKTLYMAKDILADGWTFEIDGQTVRLTEDSQTGKLSYTFPDNSTETEQTVMTIVSVDGNTKYHFLWRDSLGYNVVLIADNIANVTGKQRLSGSGLVYFDATMSKLLYAGDGKARSSYGIPSANETVYYYATDDNGENVAKGTMTKVDVNGDDVYDDVYSVNVPERCTKIRFAGYQVTNEAAAENGDGTAMYDIPLSLTTPCFYADTSDNVIYTGGNRGGYWDELYEDAVSGKRTTRDAEKGKSTTVVTVPTDNNFTRESDMLYLNTTLYDYYTDYELNGNDRDNYPAAEINSHQIYQPFRQFNQALSSYYFENNADSPLYWGNFQNYKGSHFSEISGTLNLFGYSDGSKNKFFYENNSMWDINGSEIKKNGQNATIGLVADQLVSGNLMITTGNDTGKKKAPFFDENFLSGENVKNATLGKVYKNVTFPFVKKELQSKSVTASGTVDYWYFNSADNDSDTKNKNLQLRYNETEGYYLQTTDMQVKGQKAEGTPTGDGNYFPFNTAAQSGQANKLNYGFGQKIEFSFRLTKDGTVKTSEGYDVPIEFNFSGDDDVWVFIDGELVLDVGGGHGVVSGRLNFKDMTAWVSGIKNPTDGGYQGDYTVDFPTSLVEATSTDSKADFYKKEHTLTMFYMERGLWESNMEITFNFPDESKFSVEKEVDTTDVNKLFDGVFDNKSVFQFNIKNQATHYGEKDVDTGEKVPSVVFNDTFSEGDVKPYGSENTFAPVTTYGGKDNVVHWYAKYSDVGGAYKYARWGFISPQDGKNTTETSTDEGETVKTINVSEQNTYLQFKCYYDENDAAQLLYMRIELEDAHGSTLEGTLNGKTYGSSTITSKQWTTLQVKLSELTLSLAKNQKEFDFSAVRYVKFGYEYPCNIYLDDFTFMPAVTASEMVGFTIQQQDIPDYGSSKSGVLENAVDALFSITNTNEETSTTTYGRVDDAGNFSLANGEKVTFSNQFRRGSYIYLQESIDSNVFDVSWKLYENGREITDSTVPENDTAAEEGGILARSGVATIDSETIDSGTVIKDLRKEKYKSGPDANNQEISNGGYTAIGWAKQQNEDGTTTKQPNTILFRSYADPDSETSGLNILVKQINKVKTGGIKIAKAQAVGSDELTEDYTIRIEFTNVAGLSLEDSTIVKDVTIKAGETTTITGIPAGTIYKITEVLPANSDSKLESITKMEDSAGNDLVLVTNTMVQGVIVADDDDTTGATGFTFTNIIKPTVNVSLEKTWEAEDGVELVKPDSIWVQLQRKKEGEADTKYAAVPGYEKLELSPGYEQAERNTWSFTINDLDKYVDHKAETQVKWVYRLMELDPTTIEDDSKEDETEEGGSGTETEEDDSEETETAENDSEAETVEEGSEGTETEEDNSEAETEEEGSEENTDETASVNVIVEAGYAFITKTGDMFRVSYEEPTYTQSGTDDDAVGLYTTKITNTQLGPANLKIVKTTADVNTRLSGVNFILEKQTTTDEGDLWVQVGTKVTASEQEKDADEVIVDVGEALFKDLEDGIYRLTETATASGYTLLKAPIVITIDRKNNKYSWKMDDKNASETTLDASNRTLTITIRNSQNIVLPPTGGYSPIPIMAGGMALSMAASLLYIDKKKRRRKEGKPPGT